jgi:hypothetical protein
MTNPGAAAGAGAAADPGAATGQPVIRVLRGNPDPAELAALVLVLMTLGSRSARMVAPSTTDSGRRRPGWLDAHRGYRAPGSWSRHGPALD